MRSSIRLSLALLKIPSAQANFFISGRKKKNFLVLKKKFERLLTFFFRRNKKNQQSFFVNLIYIFWVSTLSFYVLGLITDQNLNVIIVFLDSFRFNFSDIFRRSSDKAVFLGLVQRSGFDFGNQRYVHFFGVGISADCRGPGNLSPTVNCGAIRRLIASCRAAKARQKRQHFHEFLSVKNKKEKLSGTEINEVHFYLWLNQFPLLPFRSLTSHQPCRIGLLNRARLSWGIFFRSLSFQTFHTWVWLFTPKCDFSHQSETFHT